MIIDCLGNTIETTSLTTYAAYISASSNGIILKNCNLKGPTYGVYTHKSGSTTPITIDNVKIIITGTQTYGARNYSSKVNYRNVIACNSDGKDFYNSGTGYLSTIENVQGNTTTGTLTGTLIPCPA
jgi:hypothetical protein